MTHIKNKTQELNLIRPRKLHSLLVLHFGNLKNRKKMVLRFLFWTKELWSVSHMNYKINITYPILNKSCFSLCILCLYNTSYFLWINRSVLQVFLWLNVLLPFTFYNLYLTLDDRIPTNLLLFSVKTVLINLLLYRTLKGYWVLN